LIASRGEATMRHACRLGLEGIVLERKDKPYIGERGTIFDTGRA
jgi:ATP-dependent DNA ligase